MSTYGHPQGYASSSSSSSSQEGGGGLVLDKKLCQTLSFLSSMP